MNITHNSDILLLSTIDYKTISEEDNRLLRHTGPIKIETEKLIDI